MGVSIVGGIVQVTVQGVLVLAGAFFRFLLLRGTRNTPAKRWSEFFFNIYIAIMVVNSAQMIALYAKELSAERKYGYNQISAKAVDVAYLKNVFRIGILYMPQIWGLKAAFLGMYFDLKRYVSKTIRVFMYLLGVILALTLLANLLYYGLKCQPLATNWSLDPETSCSTLLSVPGVIFMSWTNIITDLMILTLGIVIIRNLNLNRKQRTGLHCVAAVGSVSIIATTIRFIFCYRAAKANNAEFELVHNIFTWSAVEMLFAFVAFTLPCLKAVTNKRQAQKLASSKVFTGLSSFVSRKKQTQDKRSQQDITVLTSFDVKSAALSESQEELTQKEHAPLKVEDVPPKIYSHPE